MITKEEIRTEGLITDYVNRSFRDIADMDYIAARLAYQNELMPQFLWSSLQAMEKYLKAIILYDRGNTKNLRHKVYSAFNKAEKISDLNFSVPSDVDDFIRYLQDFADDRYFTQHRFTQGNELLLLDKSVWWIRRYCFQMKKKVLHNGNEVDLFDKHKRHVENPAHFDEPNRYKVLGTHGYIEKLIKSRKDPYPALIYKNFLFGRNNKKIVSGRTLRMTSANPTINLHPEIFDDLDAIVYFPKKVKDRFQP